jgi:uncharacterized protein (TIGR02996 family)
VLAVDHGDPRVASAFAALRERYPEILAREYADVTQMVRWFQGTLDRAIARIQPEPASALEPAARALVARIAEHLARARRDADSLFHRISEHPDDAHTKAVLADVLQQHGDPRGELIALQLAGKDPERAQLLIDRHAETWLGPLAPFVVRGSARFVDGFPAELAISARPSELRALVGDPSWATVRRLHLPGIDVLPTELLRHPVMRSLRYLGALDRALVAELLKWPDLPYTSLGTHDGELELARDRGALILVTTTMPPAELAELLRQCARIGVELVTARAR